MKRGAYSPFPDLKILKTNDSKRQLTQKSDSQKQIVINITPHQTIEHPMHIQITRKHQDKTPDKKRMWNKQPITQI